MIRWLALLLCAAGTCAAAQAWTADDLWMRHTPTDPQISPDGRQVVYVDTWNDRATNSACANLRLVSVENQQARTLTEGAWRDRSPRWSPDSTRIAWISGRGGIHVRAPGSGQEWTIEASPENFAWSADGRWIAFTAPVTADAAPAPWAPQAILQLLGPHPPARAALFVVPSTGGAAHAVTRQIRLWQWPERRPGPDRGPFRGRQALESRPVGDAARSAPRSAPRGSRTPPRASGSGARAATSRRG